MADYGGGINVLDIYRTFFSPAAKAEKMNLKNQEAATKAFEAKYGFNPAMLGLEEGRLKNLDLAERPAVTKAQGKNIVANTEATYAGVDQNLADAMALGGISPTAFGAMTGRKGTQNQERELILREDQQGREQIDAASMGYSSLTGANIGTGNKTDARRLDIAAQGTEAQNKQEATRMLLSAAPFISDPTMRQMVMNKALKDLGVSDSSSAGPASPVGPQVTLADWEKFQSGKSVAPKPTSGPGFLSAMGAPVGGPPPIPRTPAPAPQPTAPRIQLGAQDMSPTPYNPAVLQPQQSLEEFIQMILNQNIRSNPNPAQLRQGN